MKLQLTNPATMIKVLETSDQILQQAGLIDKCHTSEVTLSSTENWQYSLWADPKCIRNLKSNESL